MNEYSKASDVFSFGISLGQIFTGEEPENLSLVSNEFSMGNVVSSDDTKATLKRAMLGKVERTWSDGLSALTSLGKAALVDIILDCLQHTTSNRPDMGVVVQRLRGIMG